jgi:hypothetical protein
MRLTIVTSDNVVLVDKEMRKVDCTKFKELEGVHAVQWNGLTGHIEFVNENPTQFNYKLNEPIEDIERFQSVIAAWEVAEPPPPVGPVPKDG